MQFAEQFGALYECDKVEVPNRWSLPGGLGKSYSGPRQFHELAKRPQYVTRHAYVRALYGVLDTK